MLVFLQNCVLFLFNILGLILGRLIVLGGPRGSSTDRVLIIRTDLIGDLVLFTSSLKNLRTEYGSRKIARVVRDSCTDLLRDCPYIDEVIGFRHKAFKRNLIYRIRFLGSIHRRNYGLVLNPMSYRETQGDQIVAWNRSDQRIGFDTRHPNMTRWEKKVGDLCYSHLVEYPLDLEGSHELIMDEYFVRSLGTRTVPAGPYSWRSSEENEAAIKRLLGDVEGRNLISVFVDASDPHRAWPAKSIQMITNRIVDHFPDVLIALLGVSQEKGTNEFAYAGPSIRNLIGQTDILEACALIQYSRLVIGSETGAIHLAASMGTQSISITGGGHFGIFVPYPPPFHRETSPIVVNDRMDCYNCRWRCVFSLEEGSPYPCIGNISVDQVYDAVVRALGTPKR